MIVRLLTKKDAPAFYRLRLRAVKEETRSFLETAAEVKKRTPASYFKNGWIAGAFVGKKLVGITGLYRHSGKKVEHKGTVWGVYVTPDARGQGLTRKMITLLLDEAKKAGLEQVHISTDRTNEVTMALYQKIGFKPYGTEKHILKLADGSYIDDVWMVKFLK
jgi:RimJ/RimL family protein N-acetyltransferase